MKKIAIIGAGESGTGAALLAAAKGYSVWVSDAGSIADHYKAELQAEGIAFEENAETPNLGLLQKLASAARITDQNLLNDMPSGNVF